MGVCICAKSFVHLCQISWRFTRARAVLAVEHDGRLYLCLRLGGQASGGQEEGGKFHAFLSGLARRRASIPVGA